MKKKRKKGYYETGFDPEPFTVESPPPVRPELITELQQVRLTQVSDALEAQGVDFSQPTPGDLLWGAYFNKPDRPSIQQVLLLAKTLRPSKG